jgi:23S rRNA-/tRNA-specific pseudouridylate synthase
MALVKDAPEKDEFAVDAKLAPHPARVGFVRVDPRHGKRARTIFNVRERFNGWTLLTCRPLTSRPHQIRAHLRHVGLPIVADSFYGRKPLWLSRLKRDYHLKRGREERPLIGRLALHAEKLMLAHPATAQPITIEAPCPKDFAVALKFLRRFASVGAPKPEPK